MLKRFFTLVTGVCLLAATLSAAPVASLIGDLNNADYEMRQRARLALRQALVDAPRDERAPQEQELLQAIGPEHDWATRDWCLRMLELVGTETAVPALADLLEDDDARIRDLARRALAAIPSDRAIDALAKAARQAPAGERGAYADALAYRGEARAVKPLSALLREGSAEAALALGKIGNRSARSALKRAHAKADATLKPAIELALLDAEADRRLVARLAETGATEAIQAAAFGQLVERDARAARRLLDAVLAQPDDARRGAFLRHAMATRALRDRVVQRLPELPGADKIVVLEAMGDLNLTEYEQVALALLPDAADDVLPVLVRLLGQIGTDTSFQPLLDRYLADARDRAVTGALARLRAPSADRRLLDTARKDGEVADRVAALRLLVLRNTDGVVELLHDLCNVKHPSELRQQAFRGLEVVGDLESVRRLLQVVLLDDPLQRDAQGSLKRLSVNLGVPDALWQECYAPVLASATPDQQRDILVIIDGISGPATAAWLQELVLKDEPLQSEALEALQRWTDISGVDAWLAIARAQDATAEEVAAAKRSIVRILRSTRTTGLYPEKVERAAEAMRAFANDAAFRRDVVASYQGELHWQTRMTITRLFPEFLSDPAIAADVQELLDRSRFD